MDAKTLIALSRHIGYVEGVLKNIRDVMDIDVENAINELNSAQELIFKMVENKDV